MEDINKNNKFFYITILLTFVTSSYDIFLTFKIAGFTCRISQIIGAVLLVSYIWRVFRRKKTSKPIGYRSLLIWTLFLISFTFNTVKPSINIGYHFWLIYDILLIFALTDLINDKENTDIVIKLYIKSFYIMAMVGIFEFIFAVLHINSTYITQWWIANKFPRINGFSYEPSYYATYLIIGWSLCRTLLQKKVIVMKNLKMITFIITIAIILSTSRMGIMLMIVYEIFIWIKDFLEGKNKNYLFIMTILGIIIGVVAINLFKTGKFDFLLSGTGVNGLSSHSVSVRQSDLNNVLEVFKESPILGRGLGGIYAQIAFNQGLDVQTINIQHSVTGIAVFAEVLAASGIFGFIFFLIYIITLLKIPIKQKNEKIDNNSKNTMYALIMSLFMELIILQFNQNILRMYVWIHIAVISMYYKNIYNKNDKGED